MKFNIIDYEYEGTAEVCCKNCGVTSEVEFTGNKSEYTTAEPAIVEALVSLGWEHGYCPCCVEVEEEKEYIEDDSFDSDDNE